GGRRAADPRRSTGPALRGRAAGAGLQHGRHHHVPAARQGPAEPQAGGARFLLRAGGRGQPGRGPDEPRAGQRLGPGRGAQPVRVRAVRAGRRAAAPAAGRHPGRDVAAGGPLLLELLLPLIIPLLASAAARPLAHRLEPRQATWLLCAAAVVLAGCAAAALALAAGFAAARLPVLAALGDYTLAPAGAAAATAARSRHRVRGLLLSYRRAARLNARDGIVVLPGPDLDAYALP